MIDTKHNFDFKFYDDASIYADKNRIKQAIRIFIENAIKFTPQNGYIKVLSYIDEDYYVIKVSDLVLLVVMPGMGDDIQVIKAGIMEIGDIFVVNKADMDGSDKLIAEIEMMVLTPKIYLHQEH